MEQQLDCKGQTVNPDISGIGVRLSFYLQNFCLVLLVDRSWEDAPGALWTFTSTSFGLTVAAIIQARSGLLSFFQALQVSNLVWLANFGSFLALASYSRHRTNHEQEPDGRSKKVEPENSVKIGAMLQMFFSMALTFYTWSNPQAFNQDHCAPFVKYVAFFAVDFPALGSGRKLGLIVTSILTGGYLLITAHEILSYYRRHNKHRPSNPMITVDHCPDSSKQNDVELRGTTDDIDVSDLSDNSHSPQPSPVFPRSEKSGTRRTRHRRRGWSSNLDPMLLGITIFQVIVFTYFIISTELLLRHNPAVDSSDKEWGFGQILALIVVVPSLISVIRAFKEHGFRNRHHRKSKRGRRKRTRGRPPQAQSTAITVQGKA
ncbi:unnamed protein product [Somion occarium]|uniref:Vomeronasal type-1 receptor n=1 Tax=Somion occarium TaxID=3059160 RepID=A0ABP1CH76_9APHY